MQRVPLTQLLTIVPTAPRSLTQSIDLEQLALTRVNDISSTTILALGRWIENAIRNSGVNVLLGAVVR
jgi:hypothetical protein